MRSGLRLAALRVGLILALGSVVWISGQRLGGYKQIDTDDERAVAAAEFAVEEQGRKMETTYKLVSVAKAESQVVAGVNYRLCLKVGYQKDDEDVEEFVRVIVYRNLQGEHSLTSWKQEDCGEED